MEELKNLLKDEKADFIAQKKAEDRTYEDLLYLSHRIKKDILIMVHAANSGHPGGAMGLSDIYSVLFFKILGKEDFNILNDNRKRVLISNGHVSAVRYAAMARSGMFNVDELLQFRKLGSRLQGHPSTSFFPEMENSSGSLGQGLANAGGLALSLKLKKSTGSIYVGISDGELQEGMSWESLMAIPHHKLDNLIVFLDRNNIQIDGTTDSVMNLNDLSAKFKAFGWKVIHTDGHNIPEIDKAFKDAVNSLEKPVIIIFQTILGKGVSFMENNPKWHGSPPGNEDLIKALEEINQTL